MGSFLHDFVFEQDKQLLNTEEASFMSFNDLCNFYTKIGKFPDDLYIWMTAVIFNRLIFCIFRLPNKKRERKKEEE